MMISNPVPPNPARETLRKAIAGRDTAKEAARVAGEAAQRGKELLRSVEAKLAAFGDVYAAILKHRAASFKTAAQGGPKPSLALPNDLLKRERGRDEAASAAAAAQAAHTSLVAELETAQKVLQRAEDLVSEVAGAIISEEAIKQAAALKAAWGSVWHLVDTLNSLRGVPTSSPLPADAVRLLQLIAGRFDHRQFPGNFNVAVQQAGDRWRAWHRALCENADAEMPVPELVGDGASSILERVA